MAKNFPYFKFIATEWLTGDIVFEDYELQGLFINICALYWHRDGKITIEELIKRLKNERVKELDNRFIQTNEEGFISISFLDEQLLEAEHISKINSINGKKGAETKRKKATAKRPLSDIEAKLSKEEKEKEEEEELKEIKEEVKEINTYSLSELFKESIMIRFPVLRNKGLEEVINIFNQNLIASNKSHTKQSEYQKHFNNWLNTSQGTNAIKSIETKLNIKKPVAKPDGWSNWTPAQKDKWLNDNIYNNGTRK